MIDARVPDIIIIDLFMPSVDGSQLLAKLTAYPFMTKVVISSKSAASYALHGKLFELGASAFFDKGEIARDPDGFCDQLVRLAASRSDRTLPARTATPSNVIAAGHRFPMPRDEQQRLAMLADLQVANPDPDIRLDIIVRHLARKVRYPIIAATIVGSSRLWVKAAIGIDERCFDREHSFCAHTICQSVPFIVTDAATDPAVRHIADVAGDDAVRAYAGVSIRSGSGVALGAVCVADTGPRRPRHHELTALVEAAALAGELVEKVAVPIGKVA